MEPMIFVDYGCPEGGECKFDGACYGEICIGIEHCTKLWQDMTTKEKTATNKARRSIDLPPYISPIIGSIKAVNISTLQRLINKKP